MKVKNETNYETKFLRKLFMDCERHEGTNPKHRHVRVIHSRSWRIGGSAWYNSNSVVMKLPRPTTVHLGHIVSGNNCSTRRVAQVYIHEVGHNLGLRHKTMIDSCVIDVDWAPYGNVPLKQTAEKPKQNLIEVRAAKARKKLEEWQKKFKRAKNLVKKYQCKVRYYDRKKAASPKAESS